MANLSKDLVYALGNLIHIHIYAQQVFNYKMSLAAKRQLLIRLVRWYPVVALLVLLTATLLGGFNNQESTPGSSNLIIKGLYLFVGLVPIVFIIAFALLGRAGIKAAKSTRDHNGKFDTNDPFNLPSEIMHGYKLALLTGRPPQFTGLTGDTYKVDDSAKCSLVPEHVPPVAGCDCGFYAFKELSDAQFELTLNPGSFIFDVDMYGIGFLYQQGFRAETQVVNKVLIPKRCMRCKILPAKVFVTTYKMGYTNYTWWQWSVRCLVCSSSFKQEDKLSFDQMNQELGLFNS